ncbi:hypothetical protein [Photobacterium sp. Hal280]|uniref:hypothetical protein n=1 Tax=Photobacterium sp. Hal280 TaxID=3035163 RepID=UPI00301B7419
MEKSTLMSIPWGNVITGVIAASSALLGVFFSNKSQNQRIYIQNQLEQKRKSNDIKRERVEEMYSLFLKWEKSVSVYYMYFIPAYNKHYTFEEAYSAAMESLKENKIDYDRFELILQLYLPEVMEEHINVKNCQESVMDFCAQSNHKVNGRTFNQFKLAIDGFDKASNAFKSSIVSLINSLD